MVKIDESHNCKITEREQRLKSSRPIYLYQKARPDYLAGLSHDKVRLSDPEKFNDPLDLKLAVADRTYMGPFGDEESIRQAMQELFKGNLGFENHWFYNDKLLGAIKDWINKKRNLISLEDEISERFREFGVACFTYTWSSRLMWAHYANSHAGYCVEYAVREMDLAQQNDGQFASFSVEYVSTLPKLCISEALFSPHQFLGRMLATKSVDWSYEREWRLVHLKEKGKNVDMPKGMQISALIAGHKANRELIDALVLKANDLNIPAYKAMPHQIYEFKMEQIR